MSRPDDLLPDLRFSDVKTFLAVRRCGSITAAARELEVTPSQVSKAITRLEAQLKIRLLTRSARGVTLSDAAGRITPHFEEVVARLTQIVRKDSAEMPELSVAAPSYLMTAFLPPIATALRQLRLRAVQMAPAMIRSFSTHSLFDLALAQDIDRMPPSWTGERAGDIRKGLFATPSVARALGDGPVSPSRLTEVPFIVPVYVHNDHYVPIEDGCPMPVSDRKLGHEVLTIALGLELAAVSNQLVFGPAIAAERYLAEGRLVEIEVDGWNVSDPLYVACNADKVSARVHRATLASVRETLEALETPKAA